MRYGHSYGSYTVAQCLAVGLLIVFEVDKGTRKPTMI